MEEVRQLVQEEGREARNLVAFHVAVETAAPSSSRVSRKPPRVSTVRRGVPRSATRLRSASTGRDKRSELRARYWALLFGDLQRAIGEIYNTVEAHENQNECQEVMLVLENYTRDFKALGEWFRLKWEYDNTPPPQRPQSLAWEIRKTDFVRPESRRAYSVRSSPSVSGKNSPSLSGHNTPSGKNSPVTGKASPGSGKISPRVAGYSQTSPKANIEFFSNKIASIIATMPEAKVVKETRLSDIKEKDVKESSDDADVDNDLNVEVKQPTVELGKAKECQNICPKQVVIKSPKHVKLNTEKNEEISSQAKVITAKIDAMESEFLEKQLLENNVKNENVLNKDRELEKLENESKDNLNEVDKASIDTDGKDTRASASPVKSEENFGDVSNDSSPDTNKPKDIDKAKDQTNTTEINSEITVKTAKALTEIIIKDISLYNKDNVKPTTEVIDAKEFDQKNDIEKDSKFFKPIDPKLPEIKPSARPAYSQAAAKPKIVVAKPEAKPPVRTTAQIVRSKTVVEIPSNAPKARQQFPKRSQTSKCSYPFNLTTGRSSLFDTTPAKVVVKKPMPRAMSSGDNKTGQPKVETKKYPPRPTSLKINEKGDKTETSSASLAKIRDCDEYSSSDTLVTQIDMSRIESSESLKTLVPEEVQTIPDGANSVEVLNVELKSDDEEWLTVTSKRFNREKKQSKSHWANRFHQPSATTSLPTLNMMESPKQENNPIINSNNDRAKSEQPEKPKPLKVKLTKPKEKTRDLAMIRQKSDVTGLKTRSARNKVQKKSERAKDMQRKGGDLTKSRLHSSLESLTIGLARSQESTEEVFDFDKWKAEFKSTFKCFDDDDQISNHNEILKAADPSEMSEIAGITSQIEENERKMSLALDFQSDADQRKLCAEEDLLNRQILELQQVSDIDLDTETDDTETDAEICTDAEVCEDSSMSVASCPFPENLCSLAASLDDRYENAFSGMSWSERIDMLVVLEALMARDPEACLDDRNENAFSGMSRSERVDMLVVLEALMARDPGACALLFSGRAQQLHAKLSQGIKRRGSLQDTLRRLQAKQARAEKQRLEYQMERANRIHVLLGRVEEVKVAKNQLIEAKRIRLEKRLQRAAENRDQHLKDIVRKAHDEEEKLREIAFIKQLEAENRRHDFLDQCRVHTARLRLMRRDRLNKLEQKAAREAAVGARRQAIEAARKLHVESLLERRKERDARVEGLKEQKKQERDDAAREKAEGVKSRLSALAAAAELEADALRSRIRDKQDASQMRLESHLQAIREKATGPRQPTTSESQDQSAREEREMQEEAARLEAERKEREKQRAIKKKARKVKQKLLTTGCDNAFTDATIPVDAIFPGSAKMHKIIQQLSNILNPLIPKSDTNGVNNEVENASKKNKNKNNNKVPNGNGNNNENEVNGAGNQQKLKKQNSEETEFENAAANVIENNNNNDKDVLSENNATGEPKNENKKKAKKNKNNKEMENKNDKPKLSQTSSVCSSLSDMSRTSQRNDNRAKVVIDMTYLERQLNELYRLTDKFSKFTKDKCVAQKLQILRILGLLFAVIAEREDLAPEFATKTISTAVMMVSQLISKCPMSAAFFITTNHATHAVKMLAERLEKDLPSEPRESELVRYLADCLSIAFDSVICSTRLYEKTRNRELELDLLSSLRGRVHTLISYLCLCGCVTRAETAGTARESVHTLLTLCSDLCLHCDVDDGPERASAMQSLRCALGTSLCGARADLCKLFAQRSSDLQRCSGFVRAARTAHLLRAVAELDHHIVQESFGEGGWPLEFRAAVARLLTHHAPNDRESPRNTTSPGVTDIRLDQRLSETMVLDLIVLVGFVVVNNPQLQETICDGWSVIKTLCTLPANWLVSKPNCHALLPTLVALSEHPGANKIICADLSSQMLEEYMESPDAQTGKLVLLIKQGRAKKSGKK